MVGAKGIYHQHKSPGEIGVDEQRIWSLDSFFVDPTQNKDLRFMNNFNAVI